MLDEQIVDMYWARSEDAITVTAAKYGKLCFSVAFDILKSNEDADECVNDTYLAAWESMPDQRPKRLMAFLCKITRNLALNCAKYNTAQCRGGYQKALVLDELEDCVSGDECTEGVIDELVTKDVLNRFLAKQRPLKRDIFVSRYWYMMSTADIAVQYNISEEKVRTTLFRMRAALRKELEKEGVL